MYHEWKGVDVLKKSEADENIILKQKIIHFQSEISRYKAKLKKYENNENVSDISHQDQDKQQLENQVAELSHQVFVLKKQIEELRLENMGLKERKSSVGNSNVSEDGKKHSLDSWFVNNLKNQNAIDRTNKTNNEK